MNRYKTECIVLKALNYKDADKIYTLFSKDKGKISVIAHGVRKISSRRAGSLDTLNHVLVDVLENHKGFKTLSEVKLINAFKTIKENYAMYEYVYDALKILHRATEEDSTEAYKIFGLLSSVLTKLSDDKLKQQDFLLAYFKLNLLELLGYKLDDRKFVTLNGIFDVIKRGLFDENLEKAKYKFAYQYINANITSMLQ